MRQEGPSFEYEARSHAGKVVKGVVRADSPSEAFQKASRGGVTVTKIHRAAKNGSGNNVVASRKVQIELLRQFAVMAEARVDAVQAMAALQSGSRTIVVRQSLEQAAIQLRSGEPLSQCLRIGIPGLSENVLALIAAGEKGGCLAETAAHAVSQLEAEERIATSIKSAIIYPAFLVIVGVLASVLMLTLVIPRFALLLGDERENLSGLAWLVFELGDLASRTYGGAIVLPLLMFGWALLQALRAGSRAGLAQIFLQIPVVSKLFACRDRERWCRVMAFALSSRIAIIDALNLSASGFADAQMKNRAIETARELRLGARVAEALDKMQILDATHLNLIRVGESSGALASMFQRIAEDAELELQENVKRSVIIFEQVVTVMISLFIGMIVYGLMSSLTSVYEAVGQ